MRRFSFFLLGLFALLACSHRTEPATGVSEPDLGWLFLDRAPYTLVTKVDAAPGPASFRLVRDLSLMDGEGLRKINGVRGVIAKGNSVQVIIGTHVEHVADEIKASAGYHRN